MFEKNFPCNLTPLVFFSSLHGCGKEIWCSKPRKSRQHVGMMNDKLDSIPMKEREPDSLIITPVSSSKHAV